jgi:uncharacterized protein YlxW (UPF0749 family)
MATKRKSGAKARKAAVTPNLQAEVRDLNRKLDALSAKVRKAESGARASTMRQLKVLERKQAAVTQALQRLGRQSSAAATPILAGLQKAWRDIELAVGQAARRFRETT